MVRIFGGSEHRVGRVAFLWEGVLAKHSLEVFW
jgi:hypothetical protein